MKKIATLILITIVSISCNKPQNKIDYATILKSCFSNTEIEILNEACVVFEAQLSESYPNDAMGIKYKQFLNDIGTSNASSTLTKNTPKPFLTKLKNSSVFDKIWIKYSETYYEDGSFETQEQTNLNNSKNKNEYNPKDFYITNPKGAYLECLIKNQENKYVNEYLMTLRDIGAINPTILAKGLANSMKDNDYNDKTVRLIIAMNLFYELELNITE
ncbi:hypothetical protein MHL31_02560 [Lutibacter sp. A80]|uniref:hypothetical protein n=1 Tax=Lutibacter sp. A80 TaxID=2918453 RepID=UPI001F0576D3|nr:hypothetical protein [Lutibacter sp. A80]UMB61093.1 hypothetical protein MHL31_02560 [Lutibacter sp. A80]